MAEEDSGRMDSLRKKIIDRHEEEIKPKEMGEALLATAFMLSFFGSAAVLMPSGSSPTGMFSGSLEVDAPVFEDSNIRAVQYEQDILTFVHDMEVYNPNVVEAELQQVTYEIAVDGETVARGVRNGEIVIEAKDDRMLAVTHNLNLRGVSNSKELLDNIASGEKSLTIEGVMQFKSGGSLVAEPYSKTFRLDLK